MLAMTTPANIRKRRSRIPMVLLVLAAAVTFVTMFHLAMSRCVIVLAVIGKDYPSASLLSNNKGGARNCPA